VAPAAAVDAVGLTDTSDGPSYTETPKTAFHEIARRYRDRQHH